MNLSNYICSRFKNTTRKTILTFVLLGIFVLTFAQSNTYPWPLVGNVGIGTDVPATNLQVHGLDNYMYAINGDKYGELGGSYNAGRTSTFSLTNSQVGSLITDGTLQRMSQEDFH